MQAGPILSLPRELAVGLILKNAIHSYVRELGGGFSNASGAYFIRIVCASGPSLRVLEHGVCKLCGNYSPV